MGRTSWRARQRRVRGPWLPELLTDSAENAVVSATETALDACIGLAARLAAARHGADEEFLRDRLSVIARSIATGIDHLTQSGDARDAVRWLGALAELAKAHDASLLERRLRAAGEIGGRSEARHGSLQRAASPPECALEKTVPSPGRRGSRRFVRMTRGPIARVGRSGLAGVAPVPPPLP